MVYGQVYFNNQQQGQGHTPREKLCWIEKSARSWVSVTDAEKRRYESDAAA